MAIDLSNLASPGAQAAAAQTPAPPAQSQPDAPDAPDQPTPAGQPQSAPDDDSQKSSDEDAVAGAPINLQRAYSKLNSAIGELFDSLGVRPSASVPHVKGEDMAAHIQAVGAVLPQIGGVTSNLLVATHTLHDENGGSTVAYPAQKLRETLIPQGSPAAKKAVDACRDFVNKAAQLLGKDDSTVVTAKSQVALIGKYDMQEMTTFDAGAALLSVPGPLIQTLARKHSEVKHSGAFHAALTAPRAPQPEIEEQ